MPMTGLAELQCRGRMTWAEGEPGWVAVPDDVMKAFAEDGFEECKREITTSRRDRRPTGGLWQGLNRATGSVVSAIWVAPATQRRALVFIAIDGRLITWTTPPPGNPTVRPGRDDRRDS